MGAGLGQDPPADSDDLPGVFSDIDELPPGEAPALGVVPAQQRLDPDGCAGGEVNDRLVRQRQLPGVGRVTQLGLETLGGHPGGVGRFVEHLDPPPAVLLAPVHRGVRVGDQQLGVRVRVVADREPETGGDPHRSDADLERLAQRVHDSLRDRHAVPLAGELVEQDRELVPAEPGDQIGVPDRVL